MTEKISFKFLTFKAEAEGIKSVRIIAFLIAFGLFTTVVLSLIWTFCCETCEEH